VAGRETAILGGKSELYTVYCRFKLKLYQGNRVDIGLKAPVAQNLVNLPEMLFSVMGNK
jgi:hypothetical protein